MRHIFNKQLATNIFAISTLLWVFIVGYQRLIQGKDSVSFLGTVVYFDMVLFVCIFAGLTYKKRNNAKPKH